MKTYLKEIYAANDDYRLMGVKRKPKPFDDGAKREVMTAKEKEELIKRAEELEAQGVQMYF